MQKSEMCELKSRDDYHESCCRLQAVWKGYRLRKIMLETRNEYLTIFKEIESEFMGNTIPEWPYKTLCTPVFRSMEEVKNVKDNIERHTKVSHQDFNDDSTNSNSPESSVQNVTEPANVVNCSSSSTSNEHVTSIDDKSCQTSLCLDGIQNEEGGTLLMHVQAELPHTVECSTLGVEDMHSSTPKDTPYTSPKRNSPIDNITHTETKNDNNEIPVKQCNLNSNHNIDLLTSSWLSDTSFTLEKSTNEKSVSELKKLKEELSLELLWIGQAISSRKTYLRMKEKQQSP